MSHQNFLNLSEENINQEIYRIFSLQRFLELMNSEKNTLVQPDLWDDPFENFLISSDARVYSKSEGSLESEGNIIFHPKLQNLYGQCWTFKRDSDALWRIYSPDKFGVRVRVTTKDLFNSFQSNCVNSQDCFIGKVEYKSISEIVNLLSDLSSQNSARRLLFKRKEFGHEEEVRLIYKNSGEEIDSDILQYEFDPLKIISEVALDPRLSKEMVEVFTNHFQSIGFKENQVKQSQLYKLPNLTAYAKDK